MAGFPILYPAAFGSARLFSLQSPRAFCAARA